MAFYKNVSVTILAATATGLSSAVEIGDWSLAGFIMPAAWDAAALTFQVCDTYGGTYIDLYTDGGTEVNVGVTTSRAYALSACTNGASLKPWRYIKVRSGTTGAAVQQAGGNRVITFVLKR